MLKALELFGFKSFADRTRFDFGTGVTAVVGPNGSGKSNVLDSIRWALGEQSAKSLRGKEMTDVIFNGSGTRRALGMAEVSLFLDNRKRFLALDTDEVVLTRRVYRAGEGEYLINGALARLRDFRDLFLGTGAGVGAYSIIEQGKVDQLLQSSTKDRRFIFEEAAGISKFKAQKLEALRRLERVEQNLLRAQDIHEEIEKQLRALRQQAGKAKKYRELADRLRDLRLTLGLAEFHRGALEINNWEQGRAHLQEELTKVEKALGETQDRHRVLDEALGVEEETLRASSRQATEIAARISALASEMAADCERARELEHEIPDALSALFQGHQRVAELAAQVQRERAQWELETAGRAQRVAQLQAWNAEVARGAEHRANARRELLDARRLADELLHKVKQHENEQSGWQSQQSLLQQQWQRLRERQTLLDRQQADTYRWLLALTRQHEGVQIHASQALSHVSGLQWDYRQLRGQRDDVQQQLAEARDRRTALASRIEVMQSWQSRYEGLEGGVRQALERRAAGDSPWQAVFGILADCLEVDADYADVVELALGPLAQALVVRSTTHLGEELMASARRLPGRVQFIALDGEVPPGRMIVIGEEIGWPTLANLVRCTTTFRPLVERILGNTFLADSYATGRAVAGNGGELRFVTLQGEVVEADGSVSAGPRQGTAGLLSRSAELRECKHQLAELDRDVGNLENDLQRFARQLTQLEEKLSHHESREVTLAAQTRQLESILTPLRQRANTLEQERANAAGERQRIEQEQRAVAQRHAAVTDALRAHHEQLRANHRQCQQWETAQAEQEQALHDLEARVARGKTELAILEERLAAREARVHQVEVDWRQLTREVGERAQKLEQAEARHQEVHRRMLRQGSQLAQAYRRKDALAVDSSLDPARVDARRLERRQLSEQARCLRDALDNHRRQWHAGELRFTELRMQRDALAARIEEDYGVKLADQLADYVPPLDFDADAARMEVEDLRGKIARLGGVNVQAVEQLEELELRGGTLRFQLDDLNNAKRHLEEVIARINEESRRLFLETFETVRGHFQEFFRRLFAGGKADLLLEDDNNVLDSGIEVIARPPGKEPRSISLLSGGEKTMTAVALLMALFRSKPSPFCILDEVDAALDEANIGRFVETLKEFLRETQFIIITHSKTTMASADMLHGVTQRESGVSIRVSIQLADVSEDGNFIDRSATESTSTSTAA